jgi:chlorobactene glucosyltransferase
MIERILDTLAHACTAALAVYAARTATLTDGWERVLPPTRPQTLPKLSIIVPARNEERTIARCVRSLLKQNLADFEVIVVDDRSEDGTAAILAELAENDSRLRAFSGDELPDGWVGKPWALAQGVRAATGDWLLFTDADSWHAPPAAAAALSFAREHQLDALSLWVHQELGSFAERAVLPTILGMVVVASGSMRQLNDPADADHALANGQYILVSRVAYDALGGHEALRGEIVEDVAFARKLKDDGRFRLGLADGSALVRVRMYTSLAEIWSGFTKNMYLGARGDVFILVAAMTFLSLLSVVPALLACDALARNRPRRAIEALAVLAGGIAVEARLLRQVGLRSSLALFAPVGYAVCAGIILESTVRVLSGRGVTWRGRQYTGKFASPQP